MLILSAQLCSSAQSPVVNKLVVYRTSRSIPHSRWPEVESLLRICIFILGSAYLLPGPWTQDFLAFP